MTRSASHLILVALSVTALFAAAPVNVSVTPSSGSGYGPQTFHFVFSDADGAGDINWVQMLTASGGLSGLQSCHFYVWRPSGLVYLANDNGIGWVGSATLGTSGTLQNTQCALDLQNCEWGATRPTVLLSAPQRTIGTTLVLKRSAAVSIRVDDPSGLLAQNEGKMSGAHLLLGVRSDALIFHPASIVAQDSGGRNYQVTVPFDAKLNLTVASWFFRLADATGAVFAAGGTANIPVSVPSGQPAPVLRLAVTGRR